MSAETWLKKYYPVPAEKMRRKTWMECMDHSILKWTGLGNLKRYGLQLDSWDLQDEDASRVLLVDSDSCALCRRSESSIDITRCELCPIKKITGDDCNDAWNFFADDGDPKPMLRLLRKVRKEMK